MLVLLWIVDTFAEPASADTSEIIPPPPSDAVVLPIVGGSPVSHSQWSDVARILFDNDTYCTGVLVAPRVVLTARHCVDTEVPVDVLLGSSDLGSNQGEHFAVERWEAHPESLYDIGVVLLTKDAPWAPRMIGLGCPLQEFLVDGAEAISVGWGSTDPSGNGPRSEVLREIRLPVIDADCSDTPACRAPGSEIFGGGGGLGPCFGDSGGPLYLPTDQGDLLVGIDSRGVYDGDMLCGNGEFWIRPEAVISWIEDQADGAPLAYPSCNEPASATIDPIETVRNQPATAEIAVTDPDGDAALATVAVAVAPEHGTVTLLAEDQLEYVPERGFVGEDLFTLAITDEGTGNQRTGTPVTIEIDVPVLVDAAPLCGCTSVDASVPSLLFVARRR